MMGLYRVCLSTYPIYPHGIFWVLGLQVLRLFENIYKENILYLENIEPIHLRDRHLVQIIRR